MPKPLHSIAPAAILAAVALTAGSAGVFAQDFKVGKLEQDVLELQGQMRQQERRIEALERQLAQSQSRTPAASSLPPSGAKSADVPGTWMNIANWDRIRTGTPELDVIQVLGPPTTIRNSSDGNQKTMFYALEIGTGSFLTGSVIVADRRVVEIQKPTLK